LQAHCINLETMVSEPAEAASHQAAQAAALVPVLGLSEQQQELIEVGMRLFYDIVQGIHSEHQSLQLQVASAIQRDGSDSGTDTSAASGSSGLQDSLFGRRALLENQQQLTSQLSLLLHKVRRTCSCAGATTA
jgi:3-oxoacyl-ACP reductase-like protein